MKSYCKNVNNNLHFEYEIYYVESFQVNHKIDFWLKSEVVCEKLLF